MQRIVKAKGIDRASAQFDHVLMPTPAAVLEGARLLADGVAGREALGPLMVVDPGGATTDVHSIGAGEPATPGVIRYGLPQPHAKRTVEGDLGMRHNAAAIVAAVGLDVLAANAGISADDAAAALSRIASQRRGAAGDAGRNEARRRARARGRRHRGGTPCRHCRDRLYGAGTGTDAARQGSVGMRMADRHRGRDRPCARSRCDPARRLRRSSQAATVASARTSACPRCAITCCTLPDCSRKSTARLHSIARAGTCGSSNERLAKARERPLRGQRGGDCRKRGGTPMSTGERDADPHMARRRCTAGILEGA